MDVEVLASWCRDVLESLLVLRCSYPWGMRSRSRDHHEERLIIALVVQEVQGEISLTYTKICHPLPTVTENLINTSFLMNRGLQGRNSF